MVNHDRRRFIVIVVVLMFLLSGCLGIKDELENTCTLTTSVNGEGKVFVDPPQDKFIQGSPISLTAEPEDGWAFDFWSGDIIGTNDQKSIIIRKDLNVIANFIQDDQ